MQRANSLEKTLILGKIEGRRRRGWQRMKWLDGITYLMDMTFLTKVHLVKAMVFPVVLYRCESWTIKKVEC